jgi:hypothetical protein
MSPGSVGDYLRMNADIDIRDVMPTVGVPTLVLLRVDDEIESEAVGWQLKQSVRARQSRYLVEKIPRLGSCISRDGTRARCSGTRLRCSQRSNRLRTT